MLVPVTVMPSSKESKTASSWQVTGFQRRFQIMPRASVWPAAYRLSSARRSCIKRGGNQTFQRSPGDAIVASLYMTPYMLLKGRVCGGQDIKLPAFRLL